MRADLTGANLNHANLSKSDLTGANLSNVDLRQANLREANLNRIILIEANLEGAEVSEEQLDLARKLEKAIMPDGTAYEPSSDSRKSDAGKGEKRKATATGLAAALSRIKKD